MNAQIPDLLYDVEGSVATITLNRPEQRNAFTVEMVDAWAQRIEEAAADDTVRVLVVTGAADAFCSGVDLAVLDETAQRPLARRELLTNHVHRVARALLRMDKPVIAAVNGVAVGAGLDMALLCDLRVASRSARFSTGYIRVGLVPGDGGAWLLPRLIGSARALELLLTGDFITADVAGAIGLVNRVVADQDLGHEVTGLADRLASQSPLAVRTIKRAVRQFANLDLETSLDVMASHMAVVQSTEDYVEARTARRDGRIPEFRSC